MVITWVVVDISISKVDNMVAFTVVVSWAIVAAMVVVCWGIMVVASTVVVPAAAASKPAKMQRKNTWLHISSIGHK